MMFNVHALIYRCRWTILVFCIHLLGICVSVTLEGHTKIANTILTWHEWNHWLKINTACIPYLYSHTHILENFDLATKRKRLNILANIPPFIWYVQANATWNAKNFNNGSDLKSLWIYNFLIRSIKVPVVFANVNIGPPPGCLACIRIE